MVNLIPHLRKLSGACVAVNTCRLTYTDSEKFEPELLDQLEAMGWGDVNESIGSQVVNVNALDRRQKLLD